MEKKNRNDKQNRVDRKPFLVLFLFIVLLFAGILTGEPGRVLEQAVQVCLSCIGIG